MRIRTWLSRTCLTGAATLTVLAFVAPPGAAQTDPDDSRPPIFQASGFTTGFDAILNTDPPQAVADIVRFSVPYGDTEFASGLKSRARAASLWPGLFVAKGVSILCVAGFPCGEFSDLPGGFPPEWPSSVEAEYPTAVDATAPANGQTGGGGPLSFTVHVVEAHAGRDFVSSRAVVEDVDFLPLPETGASSSNATPGLDTGGAGAEAEAVNPSLVHIGGLKSVTRHEFQGDVLVAFAESRLTDVSLFGGAVQIDKIVTRSTSRTDGRQVLTSEPHVVVEGVSLGGTPAEITENGIVVNGQPVDQGAINTLGAGLKTLSEGDVRLIDTSTTNGDGRTEGDATGLLVDFRLDASGFPGGNGLVGDLVLGMAGTRSRIGSLGEGGGVMIEDFGATEDFGDFDTTDFADDGFSPSGFTSVAGESTDAGEGNLQSALPGRAGNGRTTLTRVEPLEALLSGVAADRVQLLYGAWTLALIGLALGSRLHWVRFALHR